MSAEPIHLLGLPKKHDLSTGHLNFIGGAKGYKTVTQIILNAAWTVVNLEAIAFEDPLIVDFQAGATRPHFTVKKKGIYLCACQAIFSDLADTTDFEIRIINYPWTKAIVFTMMRVGGAGWNGLSGFQVTELAKDSTWSFEVYQASGASGTLQVNEWFTYAGLWLLKLL